MSVEWYVATTHYASEVIAEKNLTEQGIRAFNPRCLTHRVTRGARVSVEKSWLPGYIFCEFDVDEQAWRFINSTRGIKQLLSSDPETPTRIRGNVIEAIIEKCDEHSFMIEEVLDEVLHRFFPSGSVVVLTSGPFLGHRGVVGWSHCDRVRLMLDLFGRKTSMEVSGKNIEFVRRPAV